MLLTNNNRRRVSILNFSKTINRYDRDTREPQKAPFFVVGRPLSSREVTDKAHSRELCALSVYPPCGGGILPRPCGLLCGLAVLFRASAGLLLQQAGAQEMVYRVAACARQQQRHEYQEIEKRQFAGAEEVEMMDGGDSYEHVEREHQAGGASEQS